MKLIITDKENVAETATQLLTASMKAKARQSSENLFVLGLPTGSTPLSMYALWKERCVAGELDFSRVVTFNMDEYVGLSHANTDSYAYFMQIHLFNDLLTPFAKTNFLNGTANNLDQECTRYEEAIKAAGGVDLFFGGVGTQGHLAFNEAFSSFGSTTRQVRLSSQTRKDNARWFNNIYENVPTHALSVGLSTLMQTKKLVILAVGAEKAKAVSAGVEGPVSHSCPLSLIQMHPDATLICDEYAAQNISVATKLLIEGR